MLPRIVPLVVLGEVVRQWPVIGWPEAVDGVVARPVEGNHQSVILCILLESTPHRRELADRGAEEISETMDHHGQLRKPVGDGDLQIAFEHGQKRRRRASARLQANGGIIGNLRIILFGRRVPP